MVFVALMLLVPLTLTLPLTVPSASAASSASAATQDVTWSVTIDGRRTEDVDRNAPMVLRPDSSPRVVIDLTNKGTGEVVVRAVRIDGRVIGLSFFSYSTRIDVTLPPGATTRREFDLDLDDLGSQAVGLIPARMQLVAGDRAVLDQVLFPVDVKGSALSVYAVFGLAVAGITLVLLAALLLAIARRRLPLNRWKRALVFLPVGAGLGMTLTFTLSAARLLTPNGPAWLSLVSGFALVAFVGGYFLPLGLERRIVEAFDTAERTQEIDTVDAVEEGRAGGLRGATS
jgi:hypothetical protein